MKVVNIICQYTLYTFKSTPPWLERSSEKKTFVIFVCLLVQQIKTNAKKEPKIRLKLHDIIPLQLLAVILCNFSSSEKYGLMIRKEKKSEIRKAGLCFEPFFWRFPSLGSPCSRQQRNMLVSYAIDFALQQRQADVERDGGNELGEEVEGEKWDTDERLGQIFSF